MPQQSFKAIKLHFKGPLHISRGKDEYGSTQEILPSDALKSALFACALQLYDKQEVDEAFWNGFKVSSAFPFYNEEFFFPKPFTQLPFRIKQHKDEEAVEAKKFKKLQFLGKQYFEEALRGTAKQEIESHHIGGGGAFLSELFKPDDNVEIFKKDQHARVAIPHWDTGEDATPFYMEKLYFNPNAGLYFLLDADSQTEAKVLSALKLLADQGIGTDRNVGNGHFNFNEASLSLNVPEDADSSMTLSLYCPEKQEVDNGILSNCSYQMIKRGGYIASPKDVQFLTFRKRSVYMFTEGSIFNTPSLTGKYVDLQPEGRDGYKPNHPVWREGRPISVPLKQMAT